MLLLAACATITNPAGPGVTDTGADSGPVAIEESDSAPIVVDTEDSVAPPDELIPDQPELDNAWLFDKTFLHTIDLEVDEAGISALEVSPYDYVAAAVTIDGYRVDDIGVRLRGKVGSFRTLSGKPKFKIDFNEYRGEQRFFGLEGLALNNEVVDCSYLKEPIAYEVFRQMGVPAGRTGFALVTVNGAAYGLYVMVEYADDVFLDDRYADGSGNLYDGKYWYDAGTASYALIDFTASQLSYFQLEEGTDVALADVQQVVDKITASTGGGDYENAMDTVVDMAEFHAFEAGEQWIGHVDGYAMNTNNYRIYFNPTDGRMQFIPWDFDYAFLNDSDWGLSWASPRGVLAAGCWADATCWATQQLWVQGMVAALDTTSLLADFDAWQALTYEAAVADPRRECGIDSVDSYQATLRSWIETRNEYMKSAWGF